MLRRQFLILAAGAADKPAPAVLRVAAWPGSGDGLSARVDGKPVRILRVRRPTDDLLLLIVLDLTGDLSLVDPARDALIDELKKMPANAWAGLLRSQDGLRVLVDPGPDREALISTLKSLQIAGRAGLLETVEPAAQLGTGILRKTPVRIAILYLTDSNIYNYREDYTNPVINYSDSRDLSRRFPEALIREKTSKLSDTLASYAVPVFVVHLAWLRDRLNEAYQTGLQQMAETTGGQAWFCRTPTEIPTNVSEAFSRILTHWAIDLEAPDRSAKTFTVGLSEGGQDIPCRTRFLRR